MVSRLAFGMAYLALVLSSGTALSSERSPPLQIIVSKDQQSLVVYDGDTVVATSNVSTGKAGHETPTGVFSILEKARHHKSNIYSNAPMPFMQRLTWSGIALHASGHVPDYPASHGCVRMPNDFARSLFKMTHRGLHVLISDRQLQPSPISDAALFQPAGTPPLLLSDAELRPTVSQVHAKPVEMAMTEPASAIPPVERPPIRILITRRSPQDTTADAQTLLNQLGYDAGVADGHAGLQTTEAVRTFQTAQGLAPVNGRIDQGLMEALYSKAGKGTPPNGQMFVRSEFEPIFNAPVTIGDPQIALGAHFFQFQDVDAVTGRGDWYVTSLDNALPKAMKKRLGITQEEDATAFNVANRALSRITIPADIRARVETLLADGSSLTTSDMGLGPETGKGTDFVTITRAK